MQRSLKQLNDEAAEALVAIRPVILHGASRLYYLWATGGVLMHVSSHFDSEGILESASYQARYMPFSEALKAFGTLKEWAEREKSSLNELESVLYVLHVNLPPAEQASEEKIAEELPSLDPCGSNCDGVVVLLGECVLQAELRRRGWTDEDLLAWSEQEGPSVINTWDVMESLSTVRPSSACFEARLPLPAMCALAEFMQPPFAREGGWMPSIGFTSDDS